MVPMHRKIVLGNNVSYHDEQARFHREDGPAIEYEDGSKAYYIHGKCHREDGPAIEYKTGTIEWWLEGKQYSEEEHARLVKLKVFW